MIYKNSRYINGKIIPITENGVTKRYLLPTRTRVTKDTQPHILSLLSIVFISSKFKGFLTIIEDIAHGIEIAAYAMQGFADDIQLTADLFHTARSAAFGSGFLHIPEGLAEVKKSMDVSLIKPFDNINESLSRTRASFADATAPIIAPTVDNRIAEVAPATNIGGTLNISLVLEDGEVLAQKLVDIASEQTLRGV